MPLNTRVVLAANCIDLPKSDAAMIRKSGSIPHSVNPFGQTIGGLFFLVIIIAAPVVSTSRQKYLFDYMDAVKASFALRTHRVNAHAVHAKVIRLDKLGFVASVKARLAKPL